MDMLIKATLYDQVEKVSAKGNTYTVVRLKQSTSFTYFDVMLHNSCLEKLKNYNQNDEVNALLRYDVRFKSFMIMDLI